MNFFAHRTALSSVLGLALLFVARADAQTCTSFSLPGGDVYLKRNGSGPGVTFNGAPAAVVVHNQSGEIQLSFGSGAPVQIPAADASAPSGVIHDLCGNLATAFPSRASSTGPGKLGLTVAGAGQSASAGQAAQNVAIGDFNGDGIPDTATVTSSGISVTLYTATGAVLAQHAYAY